ncbi:MAG: hypothetical protein ABSB19_19040 [Methylomonas sp.]|jgi:hypothetical protein
MWEDPIVKETRELREEYANQFNHDPDAIFENIRERQDQNTRERVSFPAQKPSFRGYRTTSVLHVR